MELSITGTGLGTMKSHITKFSMIKTPNKGTSTDVPSL